MIYLESGDLKILVIEPANIEQLKDGELVHTPTKSVAVLYVPDLIKFQDRLKKILTLEGALDPHEFDRIHKESMLDAVVLDREYHPLKKVI